MLVQECHRAYKRIEHISWTLALTICLLACGGIQTQSELGWRSPLNQEHPLVGHVYEVETKTRISEGELVRKISKATYVLLGEKHDNADHHIAHARIIKALPSPGSVVLEMLRRDQAGDIRAVSSADEMRAATRWDKSGWPAYEIYAPLFRAIFDRSIRPGVGHPTRKELIASMSTSASLRRSLPADSVKALSKAIDESHCGHLNEKMTAVMVGAQIFKDQVMAHELRSQSGFEQGVLVAGNGHIRKDYGVPNFLQGTVSIAHLEVATDKVKLSDYDVESYDYVVFTPRVDDIDPCERFKEQLKKLRTKGTLKH